ncbi:PLP-dependent cysteine synthase family protein [Phaeovulum sp.]|uniref:PLP-dependent cysteine synthase family protein n=1 Tax=Phaeovulum sp. TaxID=2934796 RepID=UPI0039E25AF5
MTNHADAERFCPANLIITRPTDHEWVRHAATQLERDRQRSADTHLVRLDVPGLAGIPIYLKDESTHPTGSLKHRLARSLFLYGISNGDIGPKTTVVEASSGSTAVSEAYFARLLGLPFVAVMPESTSRAKVAAITQYGGKCHFVGTADAVYSEAARLAQESGGFYLDQFTNAERATDWRGNNNIAESIYRQMAGEPHPIPEWIVMSAGTGGTSATIGRYIRYQDLRTSLCVVDPEHSVFFDAWQSRDRNLTAKTSSRIEGIGRPRVEPSFIPGVIDAMIKVADAASVAAMQALSNLLFRKVGPSSGTNFFGVLCIAAEMQRRGQTGSIVTLICDSGERYLDTYYNADWLAKCGVDTTAWKARIDGLIAAPS